MGAGQDVEERPEVVGKEGYRAYEQAIVWVYQGVQGAHRYLLVVVESEEVGVAV